MLKQVFNMFLLFIGFSYYFYIYNKVNASTCFINKYIDSSDSRSICSVPAKQAVIGKR